MEVDMVADMEIDKVTDKVADMVPKCIGPKLFDAKCTRLACHFRSKKYFARFCAFFPNDFENRAGRQPLFGKTKKLIQICRQMLPLVVNEIKEC